MKILSVFGTRPEAIKMAPVVKAISGAPMSIDSCICVTAQHRGMLDQVLRLFEIKPDWDLDLMRQDQSLFEITARGIASLEDVFRKESPDMVLVQGDTTTAFIASLAAYYLKVPIGHVEAGLRTNDKYSPFPEELNRRLVDVLCDLRFAPTERAKQNLLHEGIPEESVFVTGNTVIDALIWMVDQQADPSEKERLEDQFRGDYGLRFGEERIILVTGHRRESFGKGFESICRGLKKIAACNSDIDIVYPVHLNPNVQGPVLKILSGSKNVHLIEPLDYERFVFLMKRACLILTDSGGIQEEAPSLGKPVLVMREVTERPEAIESGTAKLVGTDSEAIWKATQTLLDDRGEYECMARVANPFGDGKAAERIVRILEEKAWLI